MNHPLAAAIIFALLCGLLLLVVLAGCIAPQPANPDTVARIERICEASGLFKLTDGAVALAVPAASLPITLVNAGVDKVCMDPARFATDISTAQWLARNLAKRSS